MQAGGPAHPGRVTAGHRHPDQRVGDALLHLHAPGQVERFHEETRGRFQRATEVIGQAEVEGLVDHSIVVVQLTGDIQ
jgi:hypothetical protein